MRGGAVTCAKTQLLLCTTVKEFSSVFPAAWKIMLSSSFCVREGARGGGRLVSEDTPFPPYVDPLLHRECATEFVDWRWLCSHCLDSDSAALEYFYLSPFYAQRDSFSHAHQETLNERMRRGEHTDMHGFGISQQQGLLFSVTYSNLAGLRKQAPPGLLKAHEREVEKREVQKQDEKTNDSASEKVPAHQPSSNLLAAPAQSGIKESPADFAARCNYFNTNAIFHITLFRREPARHGAMLTLPLRIYAVIGGKIYRMAPLMEVLQQKMTSAMQHLERCFDLLQLGLVRWDLNEGYVWWARLPQEEDEGKKRKKGRQFPAARHTPVIASHEANMKFSATTAKAIQRLGGDHHQHATAGVDVYLDKCGQTSAAPPEGAGENGMLPYLQRCSDGKVPGWMRQATEWVEERGCLVREVFRKTHCGVASRVLAAEQKQLTLEIQSLLEKRKRNEEQWRAARELEVALASAISKKFALHREHKAEHLQQLPFTQQLRILRILQREEQLQAERLAEQPVNATALP